MRQSQRRKKPAFVHIPKTAGTSVRAAIEQAIPPAQLFKVWARDWDGDCDMHEFQNFPATKILKRAGIAGHCLGVDLVEKLGAQREKYFVFSVVRNPMELALSLYDYARLSPHDPRYEIANRVTPAEFLLEQSQANVMCWWLSGETNYGRAKAYIRRHYDFLVALDNLDELRKVFQFVGIQISQFERLNVTPQRLDINILPKETKQRFLDQNIADYRLYNDTLKKSWRAAWLPRKPRSTNTRPA